jgi:hypothetical protein
MTLSLYRVRVQIYTGNEGEIDLDSELDLETVFDHGVDAASAKEAAEQALLVYDWPELLSADPACWQGPR